MKKNESKELYLYDQIRKESLSSGPVSLVVFLWYSQNIRDISLQDFASWLFTCSLNMALDFKICLVSCLSSAE